MNARWLLAILCGGAALCGCVDSELVPGDEEDCPAGQIPGPDGACAAPCEPEQCGDACGTFTDRCGKELSCGPCGDGFSCSGNHVCVPEGCVPASCEELEAACGSIDDGCGTPLECGSCAEGECGEEGRPNRCRCVPASQRFLELEVDPAVLGRRVRVAGPTISVEGGTTWLYFSTSLFHSEADPGQSVARVPMRSATEIDAGALELIPGTFEGGGWSGEATVTADGLELFFNTDQRDGRHLIYASRRATIDDPWLPPVRLSSLDLPGTGDLFAPLLLPDGRTLLHANRLDPVLARRPTAEPGDLAFQPLPGVAFSDPADGELRQQNHYNFRLSCDGAHVLYTRETHLDDGTSVAEHRQLALDLTTDPPSFGPPEPYGRIQLPATIDGNSVLGFAEAADCATVYFAGSTLRYRPVLCGG